VLDQPEPCNVQGDHWDSKDMKKKNINQANQCGRGMITCFLIDGSNQSNEERL
jgi:hypothetical protein